MNERNDELVVANLALVGYHVTELLHRVPPSVTRDELASAGSLALVLAARSFDPEAGVPFARYASLRIKGALLDELRSMDWASRSARRRVRELADVTERLRAALGREPSREELASALGTDAAGVDVARHDAERRVLSIDASEAPIADSIATDEATPEEQLLATEQRHWLRSAVDVLPERLRAVISGLYLEDRSIADLADELGVTQSRISQLRTEALGLLRDGMNASMDPALVRGGERPGGVAERRRQAYFAAVAARAAAPASVYGAGAGLVLPTQRSGDLRSGRPTGSPLGGSGFDGPGTPTAFRRQALGA